MHEARILPQVVRLWCARDVAGELCEDPQHTMARFTNSSEGNHGLDLQEIISLGPLRLNLSKRGVGASAGVRGARIGVDASGKPYVSAGTIWFPLSGNHRAAANPILPGQ